MNIIELIEELIQRKIEISFKSGQLTYSGPEENITPELLEKLRRYKGKLIKYYWPKELYNIIPVNTEGNQTPIFIVHGDKGNYLISDHLGTDQPVYGFFHPGSEGEAINYKNVNDLARTYLEKILNIYTEGPFYLAGFSFGGTLAFEMAIQLQKLGYKVPFLVIIDSISPLAREPILWHDTFYKIIRSNVLHPFKIRFIRFLKVLVCKYYILINKPITLAYRKFYMFDKYRILTKKYNPQRFNGDILLFRTIDNKSSYKYLGWETLANKLKIVFLEADHTTIFEHKKSIETLQNEFEKYLNQVQIQK